MALLDEHSNKAFRLWCIEQYQNQWLAAAALGVHPTVISYFVHRRRDPTEDEAAKLIRVMGPKLYRKLFRKPRKVQQQQQQEAVNS